MLHIGLSWYVDHRTEQLVDVHVGLPACLGVANASPELLVPLSCGAWREQPALV
jgi:hypothetical protein